MADSLIKVLLVKGFRNSCFCRLFDKGIQCSLLNHGIPNLPDSMECWNWSEIDHYPWNKTWSSCRRQIHDRGNNTKTVWHSPKFLMKLTFFFLKHGGKIIEQRRYSVDWKQDGLEYPAHFCFTTLNKSCFFKWNKRHLKTEVWEAKERSRSRKRN